MSILPPPETTLKPMAEAHADTSNETYLALVWRRLKRSWTGMFGLVLVIMLLVMSILAPFFAPVDPKDTDTGFAPPDSVFFTDRDGGFTMWPRI